MSVSRELVRDIIAQFRLPITSIHGVAHWARVLENGRRLCPATGASLAVLEYFAILHDSQRLRDNEDRNHGPRAASFAESLRVSIQLPDAEFALLVDACSCHTRGVAGKADITVQTCLDADALDVPRVGLAIKPDRLRTAAARDPATIAWATRRATAMIVPTLVSEEWGVTVLDSRREA